MTPPSQRGDRMRSRGKSRVSAFASLRRGWDRRRNRRWVTPTENRIVKFFPNNPPTRGEFVLVDDERCRVIRVNFDWGKHTEDGGRDWTLHRLLVEPAPANPAEHPRGANPDSEVSG